MAPIRNAPSVLPTTLRFMGSRLAHRLRGDTFRPPADFRARVDAVLARIAARVERCDWIRVEAAPAPWTDSGLALPAERTVTVLASGMVWASKGLDVGFLPKVGLWHRVGEGDIAKIVGGASSLSTGRGGALWFTSKPSGEFSDVQGTFDARYPRVAFPGHFDVAVIQWRDGDVLKGLQAGALVDGELFGPALQRATAPMIPPAGWQYLWRLGQGEIFTPGANSGADGGAELCCHTHADVGILQFPVDVPLTEHTHVSWSWFVEQLPSRLPEHIEPTHDYLSLAIEFDNGLDLTWMWSCALPVDTIFQCPLAWWSERETHWVVRSGSDELGRWVDERRNIASDYRKAIGETLPQRITGVWLIANTVFQRGEGRCRYRDIALEDAPGRLPIRR